MHLTRLSLAIILTLPFVTPLQAKPLRVYILAGQSNMEGHAQTSTFPAIARDPKTEYLHKKIVDKDGEALVHDDIYIAYAYGNFNGEMVGRRSDQLTAGFGSQHHVGTGKIGPELTFGVTMHELKNEPILLIKNAWGGKSLMVDFRPPSGGEPENEKHREKAGLYYREVINHVKDVLADPKKVYPDYNAQDGYEIAGFVWFQGFNDLVGPYPRLESSGGKKNVKDYSEYSRLMACFIRDVRKDLDAPEMPFVIGVLGTGGDNAGENTDAFREAMAAPVEMDEFKGNVAAVYTHKYWPAELEAVRTKRDAALKPFAPRDREAKKLEGDERKKAFEQLKTEKDAAVKEALSEDEIWLLENGISNQGFHYWGSAKFFAQIGEAFAKALVELEK
jgi:hypothetical protein